MKEHFDAAICNTESAETLLTGALEECVSDAGVFDLSGNVAEWVVGPEGAAVAGGKSTDGLAKCSALLATGEGDSSSFIGFRCCSKWDDDLDQDGIVHTADCDDLNPGVSPLEEEVCDGLDNNCNGSVDESDPQLNANCTVPGKNGECAAGKKKCSGGDLYCSQVVFPVGESCDSKDNNCNGSVDEGLGTTTCGQGECGHTVNNCVGGQTQSCDPFEGTVDETCDSKDNDCDGDVDENGAAICSDNKSCTDDSCKAGVGCVNTSNCSFNQSCVYGGKVLGWYCCNAASCFNRCGVIDNGCGGTMDCLGCQPDHFCNDQNYCVQGAGG